MKKTLYERHAINNGYQCGENQNSKLSFRMTDPSLLSATVNFTTDKALCVIKRKIKLESEKHRLVVRQSR